MEYDQLKLSNQLCFPAYAASRLIMRQYEPYLGKLGLTYPQLLVLMVLWEDNNLPVNEISRKLVLNTNTVTPLLKRMELLGLITRHRSHDDGRNVIVSLTKKGFALRDQAVKIQQELARQLVDTCGSDEWLIALKSDLEKLVKLLNR